MFLWTGAISLGWMPGGQRIRRKVTRWTKTKVRDRANIERDREVAARTQDDTEFLARELTAVRLALADVVTTQDLEDSLTRLAKLIVNQSLPDGHGSLTPSDRELPRPAIR